MTRIQYSGRTDKGLVRSANEDAIRMLCDGEKAVFLVADGLGGYSSGGMASSMLAKQVMKYWEQHVDKNESLEEWDSGLRQIIYAVHDELLIHYNKTEPCGTTLCMLLIDRDQYKWYSVGDSRIYRLSGGDMVQITTDDAWQNLPATLEQYSSQEIQEDKRKGKLTQAVGTQRQLDLHAGQGTMVEPVSWLICSDGLYKCFTEQELAQAMRLSGKTEDLQAIVNALVGWVIKRGARDNATIVLIKVDQMAER